MPGRFTARRLVSISLGLAAFWLIAFHAAIFWQRLSDSSILQPGIMARWIAAALLVTGFVVALRRCHGQHANLVFWLLVALVHFSIPADERLLDLNGELATLVQAGLTAAPAFLLILALVLTSSQSSHRIGPVEAEAISARDAALGSRHAPRSPPSR